MWDYLKRFFGFELIHIDDKYGGISVLNLVVFLFILGLTHYIALILKRKATFQHKKNQLKGEEDEDSSKYYFIRIIVYVVGTLVAFLGVGQGVFLKLIDKPIHEFSEGNSIKFYHVLIAIIIIFLTRIIATISSRLMNNVLKRNKNTDKGRRYAISQITKYMIYSLGVLIAISNIGIDVTALSASLAALLVGVGIGLQDTFNDTFSGIVLLFEGTLHVGDVVDMEGTIGRVERIGLRTSTVRTRENIILTVPNRKFIGEKVINWSNNDQRTRFRIEVGVAYGSDAEKVKELLIKVAMEEPRVFNEPRPQVWFMDFADSALKFELLFWSDQYFVIEDVKSQLRYAINKTFAENNVKIPFPQQDVYIKSLPEGVK